ESEVETEEEVDILMSSDIYSATLSTKSISFSRTQSGWLFREDKTERVGSFLADCFVVNGLVLESRKRREHLSEEDILRNKAVMETWSKGGNMAEHSYECSHSFCKACLQKCWENRRDLGSARFAGENLLWMSLPSACL
ncbi:hypothetical protein AAFF_G00183390, partial [Aldrovandia affinis]